MIADVKKESPAEIYGLKKNDVFLSIDGNKVDSLLDVPKFITLSNGDFIEFIVLRNNDEYTLKVKPNLVETTDDFGNPFEKRMVGIQIGMVVVTLLEQMLFQRVRTRQGIRIKVVM